MINLENDKLIHVTNLEMPIRIDLGEYFVCSHDPLEFKIFFNKRIRKLWGISEEVCVWIHAASMEELIQEINDEIHYMWIIYTEDVERGRRNLGEFEEYEISIRQSLLETLYKEEKE